MWGALSLQNWQTLFLGLRTGGLGTGFSRDQYGEEELEGRFVGGRRRGRPGVARTAAGEAAATATATEPTTAALAARSAGDLGRGVPQGGADLVDLELDDGALLAFLGLERALLEPPRDDDPRTTGERLGDVLRRLPPDVATQEQGLAVLALLRLAVEGAGRRRDGEVRDGGAGRREPQLRVGRQVPDDGDDGLAGHGQWTSGRISLVRRTDSLRFSCRSSSATASGSAWMSTIA